MDQQIVGHDGEERLDLSVPPSLQQVVQCLATVELPDGQMTFQGLAQRPTIVVPWRMAPELMEVRVTKRMFVTSCLSKKRLLRSPFVAARLLVDELSPHHFLQAGEEPKQCLPSGGKAYLGLEPVTIFGSGSNCRRPIDLAMRVSTTQTR